MGYGELGRCKEFNKLAAVFDDEMLKYFQKQIEDYLEGSDERPAVVCWYTDLMDTDELIRQCS
jgi:hypothetical protein